MYMGHLAHRPLRALLAASALLAGCGDGGNPSSSSSVAPPPPSYEGSWRGTLANGNVVTFTVAQGQVTALTLGNRVTVFIPPGTFTSCPADLTLVAPVPIAGAAFVAQVRNSFGSTAARATFSSATAAAGTVEAWQQTAGRCANGNVLADSVAATTFQATKE